MSEQLAQPEHRSNSTEHLKQNPELHNQQHEQQKQPKSHHEKSKHKEASIEEIRKNIENQVQRDKDVRLPNNESHSDEQPLFMSAKIKHNAYKKSLKNARRKLNTTDKATSKIIHNDHVERISNIAATTVARPKPLLTASIVALFGTAFLLFMSNWYGFEYNFLFFVLLMVAGYIIGLIIEGVLSVTRKTKH